MFFLYVLQRSQELDVVTRECCSVGDINVGQAGNVLRCGLSQSTLPPIGQSNYPPLFIAPGASVLRRGFLRKGSITKKAKKYAEQKQGV